MQFILDVEWQVVRGEESKEVEIQNRRELRVLEAYYPRQSAIPPKFDYTCKQCLALFWILCVGN